MNTRSELEEERRLFYVALTRAEKQAYLTYALSRYRWGKLVDCEPSRFIEEIDDEYLEFMNPPLESRVNPMIDQDIFGDPDPRTLRFKRPEAKPSARSRARGSEKKTPINIPPKKLKPIAKTSTKSEEGYDNLFDASLVKGAVVDHLRFGRGEVLNLEGVGQDAKAEIKFERAGTKKILLKFAKLKVLN
jgi:DNA helicase II / ATP-dependent DNA helicase PcrA